MVFNKQKLHTLTYKQKKITFDEAYSSTSERAVDTLELLTHQPYQRIKNLREWNFGSYEGEGEHLNPPLPYNDFFCTIWRRVTNRT